VSKTTWDENPVAWAYQFFSQPAFLVFSWTTLAILSWQNQRYWLFGVTMFCIGANIEKLLGNEYK
jgi:hypothetical protein